MLNYLSKLLAGFCYGAGFLLSVFCSFYLFKQYTDVTNEPVQMTKYTESRSSGIDEDLEVINVEKLDDSTNYANEGKREIFVFTGEIKNNSQDKAYSRLMVQSDLYDENGKFIYKCTAWDGSGIEIKPQGKDTFQIRCHSMPVGISERYYTHKISVKPGRY